MRRPEAGAIVLLLGAVVALSACSRLTFVKPSTARGDYERVGAEYTLEEDAREAARMQALKHAILAEDALRAGRLDAAAREARQALELDPGSSEAHTLLAVVAERQGRVQGAGKQYEQAVRRAPRRGGDMHS